MTTAPITNRTNCHLVVVGDIAPDAVAVAAKELLANGFHADEIPISESAWLFHNAEDIQARQTHLRIQRYLGDKRFPKPSQEARESAKGYDMAPMSDLEFWMPDFGGELMFDIPALIDVELDFQGVAYGLAKSSLFDRDNAWYTRAVFLSEDVWVTSESEHLRRAILKVAAEQGCPVPVFYILYNDGHVEMDGEYPALNVSPRD